MEARATYLSALRRCRGTLSFSASELTFRDGEKVILRVSANAIEDVVAVAPWLDELRVKTPDGVHTFLMTDRARLLASWRESRH